MDQAMSRTAAKLRRLPGLSETLVCARVPWRCQGCDARHTSENPLARFSEYDENDRPQEPRVVVVLCARCEEDLVEAHPRVYEKIPEFEPVPGCMSICVTCPHRNGVDCRSPLRATNGGPGLLLAFDKPPSRGILCGGRGRHGRGCCQRIAIYHGRATDCSGRPFIPSEPAGR